MRHDAETIEIKEPPIQELNKKSSCLRRACFTGCGGALSIMIGIILIVKLSSTPRTKEVRAVPEYFPSSIPIYDKSNINRISVTSGKDRGWLMNKLLLLPEAIRHGLVSQTGFSVSTRQTLETILPASATMVRNTIEIEWTDLPAQPNFVANYYSATLIKSGFAVTTASDTDTLRQLIFHDSRINGVLMIRDDKNKPGTDYALLTVHLPSN